MKTEWQKHVCCPVGASACEEPLLKCTLEEADVRCGPRLPEIYRPRHMEVDGGIQLVSTGPQRAHSSKQRKELAPYPINGPHNQSLQRANPVELRGEHLKWREATLSQLFLFVFNLLKFGSLWFECLLGFVSKRATETSCQSKADLLCIQKRCLDH